MKSYRRDIILVASAIFSIVTVAANGQAPLVINILGICLITCLILEFIKILKEDIKK